MANEKIKQPTMTSFVKDLPNICSLAGLLCALMGIYFAIGGNYPLAIIGLLWAIFFDWSDGIIARRIKNRTDESRLFGAQMDSLIDVVSFGVLPSILLLSYSHFNLWFLPGAFIILAGCVIRLSYFNIFGLNDDSSYTGMAVDNNGIIIAFLFIFEPFIGHSVFSIILYSACIIVAVLNIASIKTPKLTGKWFYVLIAYVLILTTIFCRTLYLQ